MNRDELRAGIVAELCAVAPELDATALRGDQPLRQQVDLDSFDWLHFLVALDGRFHAQIPETDYQKLATLDQLVAYLEARTAQPTR